MESNGILYLSKPYEEYSEDEINILVSIRNATKFVYTIIDNSVIVILDNCNKYRLVYESESSLISDTDFITYDLESIDDRYIPFSNIGLVNEQLSWFFIINKIADSIIRHNLEYNENTAKINELQALQTKAVIDGDVVVHSELLIALRKLLVENIEVGNRIYVMNETIATYIQAAEVPMIPLEPSVPADPEEDNEVPLTPLEPSTPTEPDELPMTPLEPSTPVIPEEETVIP